MVTRYVRTGSFTGPITDSIILTGTSDNLIYSCQNIHVQGTLDGRLSVVSNKNIIIENDCMYETPPNDAGDNTQDMLGLIANT